MKTIKYKEAKTESLQRAIHLLSMYRLGSSLKLIKEAAVFAGLTLEGRTFKAAYPQLVAFYQNALNAEEAETLTITTEAPQEVAHATEPKTDSEKIDAIVARTPGTWVKHRNLRAKLVAAHNAEIDKQVEEVDRLIAAKRSDTEQSKRELYRKKSNLKIRLIV